MNKNILKPVIVGMLGVSLSVFLISSCSKKTPTLNAPVPTASFTYNTLTPTSVQMAQNLELINTSKNGMVAYWSVTNSAGNKVGTYTGDTVKLILAHAGSYTVKLAAGGPGGLSDSVSQTVSMAQDNPYAVLASFTYKTLTPTSVTNNQNLELTNTSRNGNSVSWLIAGVGNFTGDDVKVGIPFAGAYKITLTATGYGGMTDTSTQTVTIAQDNPYAMDNSIKGVLTGSALKLTQRTWIPERVVNSVIVWDNYADCLNQINGGGGAWWGFGTSEITPGTGRDGYLDDKYTFNQSGNFIYNDNNTVYLDQGGSGWTKALPAPWNGYLGTYASTHDSTITTSSQAPTASTAVYGAVPALKPWGSGTFTYSIAAAPAGAYQLGTVTVSGVGAHIGLQDKAASGDENTPLVASKTYDVLKINTGLKDATTGATYDEIIFGLQESGLVWTYMFRSDR